MYAEYQSLDTVPSYVGQVLIEHLGLILPLVVVQQRVNGFQVAYS